MRIQALLATLLLPALAAAQTTAPIQTEYGAGSAGWGWLWFVVIVAAIIIGLFAWSASSGSRLPPTTPRP
jgi:hypothetical protein